MKPHITFRHQSGVSMVVTLLMIVVVASLASAAARFALNSERSGRADRDRELAFQAAETALADGERDVMGSPTSTRSDDFCGKSAGLGFDEPGCSTSPQNLGKCTPANGGQAQSWLAVDWNASGVPVGRFTGGAFYPTQSGTASWLSVNEPRYIIERFRDFGDDEVNAFKDESKPQFLYLVTAIGYASRSDVKVVLQSTLRKASC
jgi:type IV pilus assembly protein PilX